MYSKNEQIEQAIKNIVSSNALTKKEKKMLKKFGKGEAFIERRCPMSGIGFWTYIYDDKIYFNEDYIFPDAWDTDDVVDNMNIERFLLCEIISNRSYFIETDANGIVKEIVSGQKYYYDGKEILYDPKDKLYNFQDGNGYFFKAQDLYYRRINAEKQLVKL